MKIGASVGTSNRKVLTIGHSVPIYAIGFFSLSLQTMMTMIVPLWAITLHATPLTTGIVISVGSLLPILFSISSGILVDQIGSKKVLLVCSILAIILAILHPLFPSIIMLLFLQLIYGQAQSSIWIAAQAHIGKIAITAGGTSHIGIFSFLTNLGTFLGPLLLGVVWDLFGSWAAFTTIASWALFLCLAALFLPQEKEKKVKKLKSFVPNWRHYKEAFSLLSDLTVKLVIYCTFLRLSGLAIQGSFYIVYLNQIGLTATLISFLFSFLPLISTFSTLLISFFTRLMKETSLLIATIFISIVPLILTPLFDQFWILLILAAISGLGFGLNHPLLISILTSSVSTVHQGLAVGLRTSTNRLASAIIPFIFGMVVQGIGLTASFYVIAVLLLTPVFIIAPKLIK
jgi:MFS family permease